MHWSIYRSIVLEPAAQEAADSFSGSLHRFDEAWQALEWFLARKPGAGHFKTIGTVTYYLYVQASDELAKTPDITVIYSFDEDQVVVYAVRAEVPSL